MDDAEDDDDGTNDVAPECHLFLLLFRGLDEAWQYLPYRQAEKYFDDGS